ncbi:MAG: electron transport complex subunit RsxE [Lachnospiraceae bacterium]
MNKTIDRLKSGIITENPTFVQMLGMCPTMAVTTSAINGLGMGLTTTVILILSNMMISALRKVIPDKVRIPAYIVIVASFVTIVQFLLQGFVPSLYDSLGIYIPLIVVNCIILGRAESYASKNNVWLSMFDGVGMGLGFTVGLTAIGIFRELLGGGSVFGYWIMPESYEPVSILILAPGAFFVLACLVAVQNKVRLTKEKKKSGCIILCEKDNGCATCTNTLCGGKAFTKESVTKKQEEEA